MGSRGMQARKKRQAWKKGQLCKEQVWKKGQVLNKWVGVVKILSFLSKNDFSHCDNLCKVVARQLLVRMKNSVEEELTRCNVGK